MPSKTHKRVKVKVFYHDDPPCEAMLTEDGTCPECKFVPDMQSLAIGYHCDKCKIPLTFNKDTKKRICPSCGHLFD
jgi:hypothetical protein